MRFLFTPKAIVVTAAFLSFLLSNYNWFVLNDQQTAIYVGLWVPSILATGAVVLMPRNKDDQNK